MTGALCPLLPLYYVVMPSLCPFLPGGGFDANTAFANSGVSVAFIH